MHALISSFSNAYDIGSGYGLGETLSPRHDKSHLAKLRANINSGDARYQLKRLIDSCPSRARIDNDEVEGWVEVYLAYLKAIGDILDEMDNPRVRAGPRITTGIDMSGV